MALIRIVTLVQAPPELAFDLARDIDFHSRSLEHTGERAVAGRTSGLIELGESVTWEARHFGVRQRFTSKITACERPSWFRDEMVEGAFAAFAHDHRFEAVDGGTRMTDVVEFRAPLGPLGWLAERLFLRRYLAGLIRERGEAIRAEAERRTAAAR